MKNKRIVFWVAMLMVLPLSGKLFAQAALTAYECELLPIQKHVFSAEATVFNDFNDGDSIYRLWLKPDGNTEQLNPVSFDASKPAAKTGNASLPEFYFGEKKMKSFGITGGGLVYFGETDELHPTYNPFTVFTAKGAVEKIIFIRFYAHRANASSLEAGVLATANTSVAYEINATQDTLFIAYNNVKVLDTGNRAFVCSFQYAITKGGEVLFIPVAMQPQGEPNEAKAQNVYYFTYGLYSEVKTIQMEGCFLQDLAGNVDPKYTQQIKITKQTYPNQTYRMSPPAPCQAVENPSVEWSYTASTDYIEFDNRYMTWNPGQACLFILSEEETLSGDNLPVDRQEYSTGSNIGSSILVIKGTFDGNSYMLAQTEAARTAKGLTPGTTYYLHAFPYFTDCSGILYNTTDIPKRAITTAIKPVNAVSVDAASITDNGFTLHIDKGDAERYILAVSRRQMSSFTKAAPSSKEGGYKVGDTLKFSYSAANVNEQYNLEILAAASADTQYTVTGVEPNSDYYYYVWSTDASQSKFSFETRTCAVATPYHIPAVFAFDSAAETQNSLTPAGWTLPPVGERSFRVVDVEGPKYLTANLKPNDDYSPLRMEAVSPVIKGGQAVSVSVNFYFWKTSNGTPMPNNAQLRKGDTVLIQYKGLTENAWTNLSTLTAANNLIGDTALTTPVFYSSEDFRLRFVAVSADTAGGDQGFTNASIRKIKVGSICKAISSEPEVSQIMHDRATLSWEDEDNTPRAEAYFLRYRLSETDAWTGRISKNRTYTFLGLKGNTSYTMEVAAVCAAGDTSEYVNVSFTTQHGLPYGLIMASKSGSATPDTLPEGVTLKTGALPASGEASLTEPDAEKTVWTPIQKAANVYGAGLTVDATLNNPLWLNLPVLSTGISRGKARLSFKLSAWSAADPAQAATFGQTDTVWVLFSTDNKFNATNAKIKVDWSEVTPQGKTYTLDFDVKEPYQYWAVYTGLQTAGNVLFIDSLNVEWTEIYCDAATGIRQSNLSYYSVDISWKGEGEEYGIFYNNRSTDKWDTVYTHETTYTLNNLAPGASYQYYIVVYCDVDRLKQSDKTAVRYFNTEKICEVPTLEIVEGSETWQGVTVITKSNEQKRQFRINAKYSDWSGTASNGKKDTTELSGIYYLGPVPYLVKVRAICSRDTSNWSEAKEFTTLPYPECGNPTDLKVSVNAANKTATFSWDAGENNLEYVLFVRGSRQDTLYSSASTFTLNGIQPNIVYTWSLMASCGYPLYSDEVKGNTFGLNVGVESVQSFDKAVKVRVFEDQILIENNEGLYIKSLQAFSTDGKLLRTYPVNSTQNAYIYHTLPKGAALLRVLGENGKTATYKTIIL